MVFFFFKRVPNELGFSKHTSIAGVFKVAFVTNLQMQNTKG
jgi:hypothetical protein